MASLIDVWMVVTAVAAVFLLNGAPRHHRWGALAGLAGQPAWLITSASLHEPGMTIVSLFFAGCYARGVWRGFVVDRAHRASGS